MKTVLRVEDVDCPCCAAKIEEAVRKLNGVSSANFSTITQRLVVESDSADQNLVDECVKLCKSVVPGCTVKQGFGRR